MIVDTSVLLRILKDRGFFEKIKPKIAEFKITSITAYELLRVANYLKLKGSSKELEILEALLHETDVVPFTRDELKISANIWAKLKEKGLDVNDSVVMISASCITRKEKLITLDKDFKHVKDVVKDFDVEIVD